MNCGPNAARVVGGLIISERWNGFGKVGEKRPKLIY